MDRINHKLFVGCCITAELRMHLNKSQTWKLASIDSTSLKKVHENGKDYLGCFVEQKTPTLENIDETQHFVLEKIQTYCPKLSTKPLKILVFPQVFIA